MSVVSFLQFNPYNSNIIQLARSFLALGLLLTLTFTDFNQLIIIKESQDLVNPLLSDKFIFYKFNLYYLAGFDPLFCKLLSFIVLLAVISGYIPQVTAILHFWVATSFLFSSSAIDGGDQIHSNLSLLLIPVCLMDDRRNAWQINTSRRNNYLFIPNAFLFLISLQMCIIYFHASVGKYNVVEWANGTAVFYWFNHSLFGLPPYLEFINRLFSNAFITTGLTYSVLLLEIILAGAIFMSPQRRKYLFYPAILFHLAIVFIFGITSFFFSVLGGLILYLLPQNTTISFIKRHKNEVQYV